MVRWNVGAEHVSLAANVKSRRAKNRNSGKRRPCYGVRSTLKEKTMRFMMIIFPKDYENAKPGTALSAHSSKPATSGPELYYTTVRHK